MGRKESIIQYGGLIAVLMMISLLSACDGTFEFRMSENALQKKVNAKLPFTKTYFMVFETTLERAEITLVGNKVKISFDATMKTKGLSFFNKTPPLQGSVNVLAVPMYKAATGQVFLTDVKVLTMNIKGLKNDAKMQKIIEKIIADYMAVRPIYTLKSSDLKKTLAKNFLQTIAIKGQEIVLKFGLSTS